MKKILILYLLLIICLPAPGQDTPNLKDLLVEARSFLESDQWEMAIATANQVVQQANREKKSNYEISALEILASAYEATGQFNNALKSWLQARNSAEATYDYPQMLNILYSIGELYFREQAFSKAAEYYTRALKLNDELNLDGYDLKLTEKLADVYQKLNDNHRAIEYLQQLNSICLTNGDKNGQIEALDKIASIYLQQKDYGNSLDYTNRLLELYKTFNHLEGILIVENNLAVLYSKMQRYPDALKMLQNVELLEGQLNKQDCVKVHTWINLAIAYQNTKNHDQAVIYMLKALEYYNTKKNHSQAAEISNLISRIYLQRNDYHNAKFYNELSMKEGILAGDKQILQVCYQTASEIARVYNDYETALDFYKKELSLRDSLLVERRLQDQNNLQKQIDLEKTENELALSIADEEVQELVINQLQLEAQKRESELRVLQRERELQEMALQQEELQKEKVLQDLKLTQQQLEAEKQDQMVKSLRQEKELQALQLKQNELEQKDRQNRIALLEQQKDFQAQQLARQQKIKTYSLGLIILGTVVIILMAAGYINVKRTSKTLQGQKNAIEEKNKLLEQKSEEIQAQNDTLEEQNKAIEQQREEIEAAYQKLKNTQSQMLEHEKMASLGQLTAGIAHEINNPINFVSSNVSPLKLDLADLKLLFTKYQQLQTTRDLNKLLQEIKKYEAELDVNYLFQEIEDLLNGIDEGAKRTRDIVSGLRKFSRTDNQEITSGDLHEGLDSTLLLLHNFYKNRITIEKNYDARIPQVACYPGKLNQVFMNIINNAIQAIEGQGQITITTQLVKRDKYDEVKISIKDSGKGIPDDVLSKIFDPFFTTKDVGKGTGLGLSISYGIITQHKGRIDVLSKEGKGTEFIICIPVNLKEKVELNDKKLVS